MTPGGLAAATSAEARERSTAVLVVPLGATEQHGPHLPLATDTIVATALCDRLAAARPDVIVAPALPYGASGEHADFPGTLSLGTEALELALVELGRSATLTFDRVLLVSGHGGNLDAVAAGVARLRAESRDVRYWFPRHAGDAHAGHAETSMLLALSPADVRSQRPRGAVEPVDRLLPVLRAGGVAAVSANGVLGDAAGASANAGHELLDRLTGDLVAYVAAWTGAG